MKAGWSAFLLTAFVMLLLACRHHGGPRNGSHFEILEAWGHAMPNLKLNVPDGYGVRPYPGIDFYVFYISPKDSSVPLASKATLGVYIGENPNPIYPAGPPAGLFAGGKDSTRFAWRSWLKGRDSTVVADVVIDTLFIASEKKGLYKKNVGTLKVHFFISATDRSIARTFIRAAESVEVVERE